MLAPLSVESITADQKSLTLATGTTHKLTYTVSPAGAASTVSFMSSDTSIATVSNEGVITPLKAGTATITVLAVESGKSDKVTVTVEGDAVIGVNSVRVSPESATLKIGESTTLTATISPETASNQNVTWETSTGNILSITPNGNTVTVTALAAGEGTVTAVTEDGRYTDSATIIVSDTEVEPEPEPEPPSGDSSGGGSSSSSRPDASVNGVGGTVSASSNGTVTITPDEGYQIDSVSVNGKEVAIPANGKLTGLDKNDKVVVTFANIPDEQPEDRELFTDVAEGAWYAEAVQYVYENGMMNGTSETMFSPDETTTRAMIVTILHRLENAPAASSSDFTDVAAGSYYADAVAWAAANGIVNGVSETSFAPDNPITREQLAAILYRYAQFKGYDVTADGNLDAYTDAAQISNYAAAAMQWANAEGLLTGVTATTLNPQGSATRAQVATILMRFAESIAA